MRFAVAAPAARVTKINHVTLRRQVIKLVHEEFAILGQRPAVDFEDRRIIPGGIKPGRGDNPPLQVVVIRPFEKDLLDLSQVDFIQHLVEIGKLDGGSFFHLPQDNLARVIHHAIEAGQLILPFVKAEIGHDSTFWDHSLQVFSIGGNRLKNCAAMAHNLEINSLAIHRPGRKYLLRLAEVIDRPGIYVNIILGGQVVRSLCAITGHNP